MPKVGESSRPKKVPYLAPEGRWRCPVCGAIHHQEKKSGCANPKCSFLGKLEKVR